MIVDGCDAVVVLGSDRPNTGAFAEKRANLGSHHSCLAEGDRVDPNKKMMVEGFVAAFAKAARVSDVPEEAITSEKASIDVSWTDALQGFGFGLAFTPMTVLALRGR